MLDRSIVGPKFKLPIRRQDNIAKNKPISREMSPGEEEEDFFRQRACTQQLHFAPHVSNGVVRFSGLSDSAAKEQARCTFSSFSFIVRQLFKFVMFHITLIYRISIF